MSMIIGIDASRANTIHRTGVEEYVFQIVQEIKHIPHQHHSFVLYTREPLIPSLAQKMPDHITVKVLAWPPKRLWTQIRLSWEMLMNPPDILFVPGHVFPIIHPKKTVMTVHDVAAQVFPESYNLFERWYSTWSAKVAVKKLWKVIVPSEFTKHEIGKHRADSDNISVISLAYDTTYRFIEDKHAIDPVLKKYAMQKPFVLSVGRLETKKNTVRIVQAFNLLKADKNASYTNLQLVLVGGRGHGYDVVMEVVEKSPYKDDIILPGFVDEEDLPYIMNAAEVFVFPSLDEGFGIPILEAFACGTPVATSHTTSCVEVAGDAAVLVDPLSVESIAAGIERAHAGTHVAAGLERARQYSWADTAKKTLHVII